MIKFSLVENLRKLANPIKSFFLENGLLYLVKIFYVAEVGPRFKNNKNDKNVAKLSRSDVLPATVRVRYGQNANISRNTK